MKKTAAKLFALVFAAGAAAFYVPRAEAQLRFACVKNEMWPGSRLKMRVRYKQYPGREKKNGKWVHSLWSHWAYNGGTSCINLIQSYNRWVRYGDRFEIEYKSDAFFFTRLAKCGSIRMKEDKNAASAVSYVAQGSVYKPRCGKGPYRWKREGCAKCKIGNLYGNKPNDPG